MAKLGKTGTRRPGHTGSEARGVLGEVLDAPLPLPLPFPAARRVPLGAYRLIRVELQLVRSTRK